MRPFWKKAAAVGFLTFLVLWVVGTIRGWSLPYPEPPPLSSSSLSLSADKSSDFSPRLQVANNLAQIGLEKTPLPAVLDQAEVDRIQVYEKNAQLALGTATFAKDEALIRSALAAHQAAVINEKNSGIAPERRLTLEIGVHPNKFDALVEQLRSVGHLDSISVQQRDRTGEFRQLHAQRQSLKKHQEAILKLRERNNPSLDDALKLEQRIQDIEKQLEALSVQLGDLLGKESFYHVHVRLFEYQPGSRLDRTYTVPGRLVHAFFWAVGWWFAIALALGVLAATYLSVRTLWQPTSSKA